MELSSPTYDRSAVGMRKLGLPARYDTFWGFVDDEPISVVLTVRAAMVARDRRDLALMWSTAPNRPALIAGVVVIAAAAFGIVGGSAVHRLVAAATTCLILGVTFVWAGLNLPVPPRLAAVAAVACVAAQPFP
jgi:hypothetical protein